jgi:O-antigen ligase
MYTCRTRSRSHLSVPADFNMLIVILLIAVVLTLAILGAGAFPGVVAGAAIALCLACVLLGSKTARGRSGYLTFLAVGIVLFMVITILPLPAWLDFAVGHERAAQNDAVRKILADPALPGVAGHVTPHFAMTRDRAGTMRVILLLIAGFAAAALSSRLSGEMKQKYIETLVVLVAFVAAAGYVSQWIIPEGKNLWWYFPTPHGRPVGCFINRNHFGGFVAMLCPAAAVLCLENLQARRVLRSLLAASCFIAMSLAVMMSQSRGAWLAYGASMTAIVLLFLAHKKAVLGVGAFVIICGVMWGITKIPNEEFDDRVRTLVDMSRTGSAMMRVSTWCDSPRLIRDYSLVGVGANGFRMVFPQYRSAATRKEFANAENEYVQIPVEFGIIGTALIAGLLICIFRRWHMNSTRGLCERSVHLAVIGAVVVVAVHASVDFAVRVPLYFTVFASLIGLVIAGDGGGVTETATAPVRRWFAPAAGLVLVLLLSINGPRTYDMDSSDVIETAGPADLSRALVWSPTSWQAWYHLGRTAVVPSDERSLRFAEECIAQSTAYDPNNYRVWDKLARLRLSLNDIQGACLAYGHLRNLRSWVHIPELDAIKEQR